jgi:hypothetical protein
MNFEREIMLPLRQIAHLILCLGYAQHSKTVSGHLADLRQELAVLSSSR